MMTADEARAIAERSQSSGVEGKVLLVEQEIKQAAGVGLYEVSAPCDPSIVGAVASVFVELGYDVTTEDSFIIVRWPLPTKEDLEREARFALAVYAFGARVQLDKDGRVLLLVDDKDAEVYAEKASGGFKVTKEEGFLVLE